MGPAMPADRKQTDNPDTPRILPRGITASLIMASAIAIFDFNALTGRALDLPEKMTAAIIALGVIAGLLPIFSVVSAQRQLCASASTVVAWPMMFAGIIALLSP